VVCIALLANFLDLPTVDITFYRSVFAFFAIALYLLFKRQRFRLGLKKDYLMVIVLGVLLATHWVSYFHAMQISSVAVGVIALYTYPIITVFLEPLFHGEKPQLVDIFSSFAVLFGIYLIVPSFSLDDNVLLGILWGVFSALMMSLRNIMHRRYFSAHSASRALFYQAAVVALVLLPFMETDIEMIETEQWWLLLLLGIVFTALPHTLFAHGLIHLKAKTASLIACVQVVYASVFAVLFLSESLSLNVVVGGAIIVSAAMFESLPKRRL